MNPCDRSVLVAGTSEIPPPPANVSVGSITALLDAGALRRLAIGPIEVVRRIDFTVRDENWSTYTPIVTHEQLDTMPDGFRFEQHFDVADEALACRVVFEGFADGTIRAVGEATARRDFSTNRTGFTMLHPIAGIAGRPVEVTRSDGLRQPATMPDLIAPTQPVRDFIGLEFEIEGVPVVIDFAGDTFEMEDQRNWSDASFKTYCPPLREDGLYVIPAGSTIRQEIDIRIGVPGCPPTASAPPTGDAAAGVTIGGPLDEDLPTLLLAAERGWLPDGVGAARLASLGALLLRVTPTDAPDLLEQAGAVLAGRTTLDLEIVLDDAPAGPQLDAVADACRRAGVTPTHVVALPSTYLRSHQPGGTWPSGLTPAEAFTAARAAFPDASVGAGMLTNFTEFNRHRPDGLDADHFTHGNSAIVHAADDLSVTQTLEGLREIFRSARSIIGDRTYRLGLTAIGMRTNPYGAAVSPNPDQRRVTMATYDPRARGLFGAAWAVGVLAATEGHRIEAISLAAPTGPFGLLAEPGPVDRPWYDDHADAVAHPVFHIHAALAAGGARHRVVGLPDGLAGVAVVSADELRVVIANPTSTARTISIDVGGRHALLDTATFAAAAADPAWLDRATTDPTPTTLTLEASAVLFIRRDADPGNTR
ncbi:MAG: hypothetical protein R8G01_11760 [Ilumatobacteraceae bacterium]|nr:hypothetical protein [Ilumatobacteraceae bacterium]